MAKLRHETYFNPYLIAKKEVNDIRFFRDGEVVARVGAGWIGSNHVEVAELLDIDFSRKPRAKAAALPKLTKNVSSFYIIDGRNDWDTDKVALYINLDNHPEIEVEALGEEVAAGDDEQTYYGEFFNLTATFEGERKTLKIMTRTYTRMVKSDLGAKKEAFVAYMKKTHSINAYEAGKIFDNLDAINAAADK